MEVEVVCNFMVLMPLGHRDGRIPSAYSLEVSATQLVFLLPFNWKSNVITL